MSRTGRAGWAMLWLLTQSSLPAHTLDAHNTHLTLEVRRFGLPWFSAEFHQLSGEFIPSADGGRLDVLVRTDSIECQDPSWNERLRSAQWLDTRRFPRMTYHSSSIRLTGSTGVVQGELTLHGVTRPLTLQVSGLACSAAARAAPLACQFLGRGEIKRSEFGLPHGFWQGGDAVQVLVRGVGG